MFVGSGHFAMYIAVFCLAGGVHPMSTLEEGLLEMASYGSDEAVELLRKIGSPQSVIESARGKNAAYN